MKYQCLLARTASGKWLLSAPPDAPPRAVCTVSDASRTLSLSRRQVYRLVRSGALPSHGKAFGERLLDLDSVERLARAPAMAQPVPARLQRFFPEYEVSKLNAGRDRTLILSRVLERGGEADVRWLLKRFRREDVVRFIEEDGVRLLSRRSLRLWALVFRAAPKPPPAWRTKTNPWLDAGN